MPLDKNSFVPLYYQLAELVKAQITSGELSPGDNIPEHELIQKFHVSRGTVREAMRLLSQDGLISKERGRGTFVTVPKLEQKEIREFGFFTKAITSMGLTPSAKILFAEPISAPTFVRKRLHIDDSDQVVLIRRVRYADGHVMAIETEYFRFDIGEKLLHQNLNDSIYHILQEQFDLVLHHSKNTIEAGGADEDEAELLDLHEGDPILCLQRTLYLPDNTPLEFAQDIYRADRIKFSINIDHQENGPSLHLKPNIGGSYQ